MEIKKTKLGKWHLNMQWPIQFQHTRITNPRCFCQFSLMLSHDFIKTGLWTGSTVTSHSACSYTAQLQGCCWNTLGPIQTIVSYDLQCFLLCLQSLIISLKHNILITKKIFFQDKVSLHSSSCLGHHHVNLANLDLTEICQPLPLP